MLFYIILTIPIAEIIFISITNSSFRLSHSINKNTITKGDSVIYRVSLTNPGLLVLCPMTLHYEDGTTNSLILYPNSSEKIERCVELKHRGSYNIGISKIEIIGFLGLFNFNYQEVEFHKVLVFPKIYNLKSFHFNHKTKETSESVLSFDKNQQSLFSDIREYQSGDSFSRIHWKLSASKGDFITKVYQGDKNHEIKIFIDNCQIKDENRLFIEDNIIESATTICKHLLDNSNKVELLWNNYTKERIYGEIVLDFYKLYKSLAHIRFEHEDDEFRKLIENSSRVLSDKSVLILFTTNITSELHSLLILKQKQGFEINIITPKTENNRDFNLYDLIDQGIKVYNCSFISECCIMERA
ncbi:MAG: DUF58 domain-containing protein [Spirochaetaceae bacterium]